MIWNAVTGVGGRGANIKTPFVVAEFCSIDEHALAKRMAPVEGFRNDSRPLGEQDCR